MVDVAAEVRSDSGATEPNDSNDPVGRATEDFALTRLLGSVGRLIGTSWMRWLVVLGAFIVVASMIGLLVLGFTANLALAVHGTPDTWHGVAAIAAETLLPSLLVVAVVGTVAASAMMLIFDDSHRGRRPSLAHSLGHGIRRLPAMVTASALAFAGVVGLVVLSPILCVLGIVGLLLTALLHVAKPSVTLPQWLSARALVIAAIPFGAAVFWAVRWTLVLPTTALESRSARDSLTRSAAMATGRWWPIARVAAVLAAIAVVPQLLIQLIADNRVGQMVGGSVQLLLLVIPLAALVVVFRAITPDSDPQLVVDRRSPGGLGALNALAVLVVFSIVAAGMVGAAPSALAYQQDPVPTVEPVEGDPVAGGPVDEVVVPVEDVPAGDPLPTVESVEGDPVAGGPVDEVVVPAEDVPAGDPLPTVEPVESDAVGDVAGAEAQEVAQVEAPTPEPAALQPAAAVVLDSPRFVVNDLGDEEDLEIDGVCSTASGACTLRAALDEANSPNVIGLVRIVFAVSGNVILGSRLESEATLLLSGTGHRVVITGGGGTGLVNFNGPSVVASLTFAAADAGYLGGAVNVNALGQMENVTFANNPGVALALGAESELHNATFSGNGGDVEAVGAEVTIGFSTFADSRGPSLVTDSNAPFVVAQSILAGQTPNCTGVINASASISTDASCSGAELISEQLLLAAGLANNGGDVDTIAVPSGSPAVDAASADTCADRTLDARGQTRPAGPVEDTNPRCDYGSYEWQDDGRRDFVVNSAGTEPDAVRDGICATAAGVCTLRAVVGEVSGATGASNRYWVTFDLDLTADQQIRWGGGDAASLTNAAEFHLDGSGQKVSITGHVVIDIPVWSLTNVSIVETDIGCAELSCIEDLAMITGPRSVSGTIKNVTFANNQAAVFHQHGALDLVNVTFWRNGYDISNSATLSVEWSTLAQSRRFAIDSVGTMTVANSIVSGAGTAVCLLDAQVTLINSWVRDDTCTGGLNPAEPLLGGAELADNGGDVPTVALQQGSRAVDALACTSPATDARGIARPQGASCDLGAFEWDEAGANTASVTGQIWNDADFDGVYRVDETGVTNAAVSLIQVLAGEQTLRGVRTSVDGNYTFLNVGVGDYLVCLDLGDANADRFSTTDFAAAIYDVVSVPGSACRSVTLADAVAATADFAVTTVSSIGGRVWNDIDGDGRAEPGETGVDGVVVRLLDPAGDLLLATETVDGRYLFSELKVWEAIAPGYIVEFVPPEGSMFTIRDASQDDVDSDANQTTGRTLVVGLQGGQDINSVDAGVFALPGIGDRVFDDLNGNGVFEPGTGEVGLAGITVNLYADPATGVVATTTTDDQGNYRFDGLARQGYAVEFVLPEARLFSPVDQGADDGADSDADPSTGRVAVQLRTYEFDDSIDAGMRIGAGVSGVVWDDLDQDGVLEAGEPGLVGVAVQLLTSSDLSVAKVTTTDVDGRYTFVGLPSGRYIVQVTAPFGRVFSPRLSADRTDGLSWVYPATGQTGDFGLTPGGELRDVNAGTIELVPGSISGVVWRDSNADGVIDAGEPVRPSWPLALLVDTTGDGVFEFARRSVTGVDGSYQFNQLAPGAYQVQADPDPVFVYSTMNPADAVVLSGFETAGVDLGVLRSSVVGDRVWNDADGDGVQDPGESGVAGVAVSLLDAANQLVASTETDADGVYAFDGLRVWETSSPGYVVAFEPPAGWTISPVNVGTDDRVDSDADPVSGRTQQMIVALGADDTSIDAGLFRPAAVSGQVWDDVDRDGIRAPLEAGLPGVDVRVVAIDDLSVVAATTTTAQGQYRFDSLAPGRYRIEVTVPLGRVFSPRRQGSDNRNDSEIFPETARTAVFRLFGGNERSDVHAGIHTTSTPVPDPSSISGVVWRDVDFDTTNDAGEQGLAGWPVMLFSDLDNDGAFELARSTVTAIDGTYRFSQVEAGRYRVQADDDPVFVYSSLNPADVSVVAGVDLVGADFGVLRSSVLGDRVWNDANGNGVQDPGEPGVADVVVQLLDSAGDLVASTTTDTDGGYLFSGLRVWEAASPGYVVAFEAPTGWVFSTLDVGTDDRVDSDADPVSGRSGIVRIALGADDTSIDAGIFQPAVAPTPVPPTPGPVPTTPGPTAPVPTTPVAGPQGPGVGRSASVDGVVWDDTNRDGIFTASENGVVDIDVLLLRAQDRSVVQAATTAADGSYYFVGMAPGLYVIEVAAPAGRSFSPRRQGADRDVDSEIIPGRGQTVAFRVDNGAIVGNVHIGLIPNLPSSITGRVWDDRSADGVRSVDEPGRADWPVSLFADTNADGQFVLLRSTLSAGDGTYRFGELGPGSYRVEGADDTAYRYSTPLSAELAIAPGDGPDDVDFGVWRIPGLEVVVFDDVDRDGQLDPGEPATAQPVVITVSADPDGDGDYEQLGQVDASAEPTEFAGLEPGPYRVEITQGTYAITTSHPIDVDLGAGPDTRIVIGIAGEACHRVRLYPIGPGELEIAGLVSGQECVGPAGAGYSAGSVVRLRSQGSEAMTPAPYVDAWSFRDTANEYRTAGADDQVSDALGDEVLVTMGDSDQRVFAYFRRCVSLDIESQGPGTVHTLTAPDCPTAPSSEPSLIVNSGESTAGLYRQFANVFLEARGTIDGARLASWTDVPTASCDRDEDERSIYAPDGCVDEWRALFEQSTGADTADLASVSSSAAESYVTLRLTEDTEVAPFFWDLDECQFTIRIQASQPSTLAAVGSASGFSDVCPNASLDDWDPAIGTSARTGTSLISLVAVPQSASPIVGWCYSRESFYNGQEVCVEGGEFSQNLAGFDSANEDERALEWVLRPVYCVEIAPSVTLVDVNSDVESTVEISLNQPPEQPFVTTSEGPNCPIVRNVENDAWLVGTDLSIDSLPIPYTLRVNYDRPDLSGAAANVPLDVRYEYQCFTLTNPYAEASNERPQVSVGTQPNCPSAPGESTDRVMSFLDGTIVPLSATMPRGVRFNYWEAGTYRNLVHDPEHTAIIDADEVLSIDYGEIETSIWDDIAVGVKKGIGAIMAVAPVLIPLVGVVFPAFGLAMMMVSLGSLGLSALAKATGDKTLADISSVVSLASPAGMKCYAAWGLSDQRNTVGDDAAFQLRTDYAEARLPVAGAQVYAKAFVRSNPGDLTGAAPVLGVIGGAIDVGFNIEDIDKNYGIGSENFADEAFGQSDDFNTCIAAGNEDSIFLSKD